MNPLGLGNLERSDVRLSPVEYRFQQRPLQRVLMLCNRSIDDVVNSRLTKNEVLGYWKVYKRLRKRAEIVELERQWNPLG